MTAPRPDRARRTEERTAAERARCDALIVRAQQLLAAGRKLRVAHDPAVDPFRWRVYGPKGYADYYPRTGAVLTSGATYANREPADVFVLVGADGDDEPAVADYVSEADRFEPKPIRRYFRRTDDAPPPQERPQPHMQENPDD